MANVRISDHLLVAIKLYLLIATSTVVATMSLDYSDALDKSLMFFEAQRSGRLPSNQRVDWRKNSGLSDGFSQKEDLVGGYYDAGDHVKFGLPMAYSVTLLAWAAVDFKNEIVAANQLEHTLQAIKWGTDYFIKAHCQDNVLYAQVGDGESDHSCWQRAEDMTTPRTAYRLDSSHPGSDVAGETAAALAAASLAFQPYNSSYAQVLLDHAKQLFSFADTFKGQYDDSIPSAESFYPSSGYSDELLWAAAWLYRASNNDYYLQYATDNAADLGGTGNAVRMFSWDNKYAGLQVLLSKVYLDGEGQSYCNTLKQYKAKADFFACAYLRKNSGYNVPRTPGGLAYLLASNNLQYAASASFLLAVYSDYLAHANSVAECPDGQMQPQDLLDFSKSQADYILGKNPQSMSYLVGFGTKYPKKIHHRGSSIPSISTMSYSVGCVQGFESWFKNPQPNPNILYGALIGGPDSSDSFSDERDNYDQSEPTTTAVAPLIGLFSKLNIAYSSSTPSDYYQSPTITPPSPEPQVLAPKQSSTHVHQNTSAPNAPSAVPPPKSPPVFAEVPSASPSEHLADAPAAKTPKLQHSLPPAPAPSPADYLNLAPSSEAVDYVLTQTYSSSSALEEPSKYIILLLVLILTSFFAYF